MHDSFLARTPIIYLITKGNLTEKNFRQESHHTLQIIRVAVSNNIPLIQIREKQIGARLVFELVEKALEIARGTLTKILVNERLDIALAANADGVHLTSSAIPTKKVREIMPQNFLIGVSSHSLGEAKSAQDEGADFVTFSPVFVTASKAQYGESQGLDELKKVCDSLDPFPIIALGGIREDNYSSVLKNGAQGFAAITFFNAEANLKRLGALDGKI